MIELGGSSGDGLAFFLFLSLSFVAVEFDARLDLKSGNTITAWIDYNTEHTLLNVFLSYSRTSSSKSKPLEPPTFTKSKHGLHSEGKVIEAADKRLNGEFEEEEMRLSCVANPDSAERPSMRRVLQILNNVAAPLVVLKVKPTLTFSSDLPLLLTIEDIVSEADEEEFGTSSQSMCEIKIH